MEEEPRNDEDIKQDVTASLYWDTRVDSSMIGVFVREGHVTLTGSVPTYRSWLAAREDAWVIGGVERVENRLEVEISPRLEQPTDDELRAALVEVLGTDPDLAADAIDAQVSDGKVTLSGTVPTYWEREMARILASTLPGLRGLVNELVVVPGDDHRDAAIADDLRRALRRNRHVNLSRIDVAVTGGRVVVSGVVTGPAVRQQVLAAVRHTRGVTEIVDNLVDDPAGRGRQSASDPAAQDPPPPSDD